MEGRQHQAAKPAKSSHPGLKTPNLKVGTEAEQSMSMDAKSEQTWDKSPLPPLPGYVTLDIVTPSEP